jgi:hypothetical protein
MKAKNYLYLAMLAGATLLPAAEAFGGTPDPTTFIDWRISPPTSYVGMSLGMARRWGGYGAFRASTSMFNPYPNVLGGETGEGAVIDDLSAFDKTYNRFSLTLGVMLRLDKWLYLYGGVGGGMYGPRYRYDVRDEHNTFAVALADPGLTGGFEVEYGAKVNLEGFTLSAGHSVIPGINFGELHFGVGVALAKRSISSFFGGDDFNDKYLNFKRDNIHKAAGGFHLKFGGGVDDTGSPAVDLGLHFNNSRAFPINAEVGIAASLGEQNSSNNMVLLYSGMYSSLHFTEHFSLDFGGGYQLGDRSGGDYNSDASGYTSVSEVISQPYYKAGLSYMFKGSSWGGFNYSYRRGFSGKGTPAGMHLFTYTVGTTPTWITLLTGVIVGLATWAALSMEDSESSTYDPYCDCYYY